MSTENTPATFNHWCVVELMGHRRIGAKVTEETIAGQGFLRLDIPWDPPATQYVSPSSVYCLTPTTEAIATQIAKNCSARPVNEWEMPRQLPSSNPTREQMDRALEETDRDLADGEEEDCR